MRQNIRNAIEYGGASLLASALTVGLSDVYSKFIQTDIANVVGSLSTDNNFEDILNYLSYPTIGVGMIALSALGLAGVSLIEARAKD